LSRFDGFVLTDTVTLFLFKDICFPFKATSKILGLYFFLLGIVAFRGRTVTFLTRIVYFLKVNKLPPRHQDTKAPGEDVPLNFRPATLEEVISLTHA